MRLPPPSSRPTLHTDAPSSPARALAQVGSVTSLISSGDAVNAHIKANLLALKKWMARAALPPEMRLRVLENFYEQHVHRKGRDDRSAIADLPKFLQHSVTMYLNQDIVRMTALFRGCSATLVACMLDKLHAHRCLPLDQVVHRGDVGEELYLIKDGLFEVLNDDETVHRMLGRGSYFGEIALLCNVHRTMSVRAATHALVFVIERQHFIPLISEFPLDMNQLVLSASLRYRRGAKVSYVVVEDHDRRLSESSVEAESTRNSARRGSNTSVTSIGGRRCSSSSLSSQLECFTRNAFSQPSTGTNGVLKNALAQKKAPLSTALPNFHEGVIGRRASKDLEKRVEGNLKKLMQQRKASNSNETSSAASNAKPVAFKPIRTTDPEQWQRENMREKSSLVRMEVTQAERLALLRDAEVLKQLLMTCVSTRNRAASIDIDPDTLQRALNRDDGKNGASHASPGDNDALLTPVNHKSAFSRNRNTLARGAQPY